MMSMFKDIEIIMSSPDNSYANEVFEEWNALPEALKAASEGRVLELRELFAQSLAIARTLQDQLISLRDSHEVTEGILSIMLLASTFEALIEPPPDQEYCQMLAIASLTVLNLEKLVPDSAWEELGEELPEL